MDAISDSAARDNLKAVIDEAVASRAPIAITRQRGEACWCRRAKGRRSTRRSYLLRSPANAHELLASIAELDAGEGEEPGTPRHWLEM